jgi:peptidoglycan/LPS O-acetylase OafA/YrhL
MLVIVIIAKIIRKYAIGTGFFVYYDNNFFFFLQNLLSIQNGWLQTDYSFNGPSWSISVEIMMYIIFYAVFYYSHNSKKYFMFCLFFIYLGLLMFASGWNKPFFNGQLGRGFTGFFIGCATGEILNYCKNHIKLEKCLFSLCVFAVLVLTIVPAIGGYKILPGWSLLYTFAFFPALIIITLKVKIISRILSLKLLLYFSEISYSIYLVHYPMQLIVKTIDDSYKLSINYSSKIFFCIFILSVILISHCVHYLFEKPIQNYIRKKVLKTKYNCT